MNEIREKRGLVYHIGGYFGHLPNEGGYSTLYNISFNTTSENMEEVRSVYKDVFNNYKKHITKERFDNVVSCLINTLEENEI